MKKEGMTMGKERDLLSNSNSGSEQYQELQQIGEETFNISILQTFSNINQICSKSVRALNQIATNITYNARHSSFPWIQRKPILLQENGDPAYLFGKRYVKEINQQEFYQDFQSIIWISYRTENEEKISDAGWGCMIRVCQMMLAEVLKRCCKNKLHSSQIFREFLSDRRASFSFDKICQEGNIVQRWTSSTQILAILIQLAKRQKKFKLSIDLYNSSISLEDLKEPENYPLLLTVANRLGQKNIAQKYWDHVLGLLENKNSVGVIGGIGGEAIFITGHQGKSMIALDPHYVQSQGQGKNIHFKKTPRGIPIDKIVPTIAFCYYFQNQQDHLKWIEDMAQLCEFHRPNMAIEIEQEYSRCIYEKRHPKSEQNSDQYEILE